MSLFKNGMMGKPDKPSLQKMIMCDEKAVRKENIENPDNYVLDGGALLHRVRWFKGMKFFMFMQTTKTTYKRITEGASQSFLMVIKMKVQRVKRL